MGKFIVFVLLWQILGNPFIAILVILVVGYFLERRYLGFTPSIAKPFKRSRKLSALRRELESRPHDTRSKLEAARLYLEKKQFRQAHDYLEQVLPVMDDSAEVMAELGWAKLKLGQLEEGEALVTASLERNPRVRYGEPYLWLGEAFMDADPEKALGYLEELRRLNSSSTEAYYRMGELYTSMGRKEEAVKAFGEALRVYRSLPKYKRKTERKWAILSRLKKHAG